MKVKTYSVKDLTMTHAALPHQVHTFLLSMVRSTALMVTVILWLAWVIMHSCVPVLHTCSSLSLQLL